MTTPRPTDSDALPDDNAARLESLYTLLAEGLKHPDETFHADVLSGRFDAELARLTDALGIDIPEDATTVPDTRAAFDNEYVSLFEGLETPYAPPIESAYRAWHDGSGDDGLLSGPPAVEMRRRYEALGVEDTAGYHPDHVALQLEYAAVLLSSGATDEHLRFLRDRLGWVEAFAARTETAAADAPFHRRCVLVARYCLRAVRDRFGIDHPTPETTAAQVRRADARLGSRPAAETPKRR